MNAEHANLLNLSPSERLLLVQDLWDSLNIEAIPLTEWQKEELDRRKAKYRANPDSGVLCTTPQKGIFHFETIES